jgi:hypothetical protein
LHSTIFVTQPIVTKNVLMMQKDDPEEDMDTRGGGQAADDRRIVKEEDYGSDNVADFMDDKDSVLPQQQAQHAQQAQQQSGYQESSRPGTPGRGSVVSHSCSSTVSDIAFMHEVFGQCGYASTVLQSVQRYTLLVAV